MPLFVMIGHDGTDGATLRKQHRDAHVAHVRSLNEQGRIILAGPIKDDDDEESVGAVIVFTAADLPEARRIVNEDPYVQAGVFQTLIVQPFRKAFPETT